jgi:ribosomal protein S18 acetylase RimI-like enzyme
MIKQAWKEAQLEMKTPPQIEIRPMTPDDLEAVAQVDVMAFSDYNLRGGKQAPFPRRTRASLLASLDLDAQGCFIAWGEGALGYIFSRCWGKLGWIGVFGVQPAFQGQHIGRRLIAAALESLEARECAWIGLETMPDNLYNVGFYARLGFRPAYARLTFEKLVEAPAHEVAFDLLSSLPQERALAQIARLSQSVQPGLDYSAEAVNAQRHAWGETLLLGWPDPWGFAILRTAPTRSGACDPLADVDVLVVQPEQRGRFPEALGAVEAYAHLHGAPRQQIPVYAGDWLACQQALAYGMRVQGLMLRFFYKGDPGCLEGVNLSRWAM